MTPYYVDERVTLYHGDCRDILPALGPASVDALLTDPPYGINAAHWDRTVAWEAFGTYVLRPSGFIVAFGLLLTLASVVAELERAGLEREQEMVWARGTLGTGGDRYGRSHELFAVLYKPPRIPPRVDRVRVPYAAASKPSPSHKRHPLGAAPGSVWYFHETSGSYNAHEHETAKPLPLMTALVVSLTDPGEVVCDPFAGSGTTLRAAKDNGRRAIGIEREERFCEQIAKRLGQEALDFGEAS